MLPASVALLFSDSRREYFASEDQYLTEKSALPDAQVIAHYCEKLDIKPILIPANEKMIPLLEKSHPDLALNLVGSVRGKEHLAATIPAILEFLRIPFTGADFRGESMAYDKYHVKKRLEEAGVPIPYCQLFRTGDETLEKGIKFPVIVKLNEIHGSVEITKDAVCPDEEKLRKRISYLTGIYRQSVLVENFIVGDEFSAIGFEHEGIQAYAAKNIFARPDDKSYFASFTLQWSDEEVGFEKYEDGTLAGLIKKGYQAAGMRDYGKFDVRQRQEDGIYYFLDANTNPAFGPKENNCAIATVMDLYGISFEEMLRRLFNNVLKRKIV